ncbi:MAG: 2Fe-2S iron-sulfur cluster-binding protein [Gammaproteobacteria bacterium]
MGLLIDRSRPVTFRFEGQTFTGLRGDTIASALAANGRWLLGRSFKYHRARGVRSMDGLEADPMVQLAHEPNVAADRRPITPGLEIRGQHYSGSLDRDRLAVIGRLARFLPVGFYYKALFRPKGAWQHVWEPLVRRGAGLGQIRTDSPHGYYDKAYAFCDVAVVGGGAAGMAAALSAARAGAEVLLIEQERVLGGALNYARFDADNARAQRLREHLIQAIGAEPRIEVMTDALCNAWFADNWLPVIRGNRLYKARAREVILATGAMEQPAVFRNNDLPGVMLGSAAQRLIRLYGVRPGRRAVVLTGNSSGYGVALDLADAGVDVARVVDMRANPPNCALAKAARGRGLSIVAGHTVYEALPDAGRRHVQGVMLARILAQGQCETPGQRIECDLLCMSPGYTPMYQLALQAGARLDYEDTSAMFSITGLPAHMRLSGAVDGAYDLDAALAEGAHAGWQAAHALGLAAGDEPQRPAHRAERGINFPWPIFPHPKAKEFIDLDEDLHHNDIVNACADGYAELELVKRYSTVGMGPSQGRHSALATARVVAHATNRKVAEIGVTTARPPFAAEKLGVLAGRGFEPERFTAMHHRHLEAGATMMPVGLWWRPAFYGPRARREGCIRDEWLAIRNNVGLIDVSTLGGIDVRGPDSAEFLNRMYTFAYLKQPVGRARYLLMTNEAGAIIDDGVAVRFDEEHFYLTATTGGVDNVYRAMLWRNAQWRLDIDIANVTAAYAGINIAGPRSREVLARLCHDVDLSAEGFPAGAARMGTVAGIPARLIRVGFVGELGYELHVPASQGEALWDALLEAGKPHDIRPVGVEAQRNLRLEKGHIIVGQDTDAMTSPHECNMGWAVKFDKPFFVGQRSLEIRLKSPSRRRLVGFEIDDPAAPVPEESNIVVDGDRITGQVTSVARSPVLHKIIGMAYAHAGAGTGDIIHIKLTGGRVVDAKVIDMPFYDPQNKRQEM